MTARALRHGTRFALWISATTAVGAVIGSALALYRNEFAWPTFMGSILFANVVGLTVVVVSWVLFPRARALPPALGAALLVLALVAGSILGTAVVVFAFPLFVLSDVRQAIAIAMLNGLLALVVGGVLWVYEGLRRRLEESLREVEEIKLHEAELTAQAARAELSALQARINPHFFFNTLNTISSLLQEEPDEAEEILMMLSELFRYTFQAAGRPVRLDQELDFVRRYLTIERARFGERLRLEWDIEDAVRGDMIPGLILQPLVENAIQHGISPKARGGRVRVLARRNADRLCLEVRDDGAGLPEAPGGHVRDGHGLGNVEKRLRVLYPNQAALHLFRDGADTVSRLELPVRELAPFHPGG